METWLFGFATVDVGEDVDEIVLAPARTLELRLNAFESWDQREGLGVVDQRCDEGLALLNLSMMGRRSSVWSIYVKRSYILFRITLIICHFAITQWQQTKHLCIRICFHSRLYPVYPSFLAFPIP